MSLVADGYGRDLGLLDTEPVLSSRGIAHVAADLYVGVVDCLFEALALVTRGCDARP